MNVRGFVDAWEGGASVNLMLPFPPPRKRKINYLFIRENLIWQREGRNKKKEIFFINA